MSAEELSFDAGTSVGSYSGDSAAPHFEQKLLLSEFTVEQDGHMAMESRFYPRINTKSAVSSNDRGDAQKNETHDPLRIIPFCWAQTADS